MASYRKLHISEVKDLAPDFGMSAMGEARFARQALGAERIGMAHYTLKPDSSPGFGHRHGESEEMYVVLRGSGRFKLGDEIVAVGPLDVVYCPPELMRAWQAGPDGMEMLAFGAHTEGESSDMDQEFWSV
ncbi:MAG TPA: hypothetical protein VG223_10545 [Solirubrobacteraceae bacterium]|jgi:quercetin dioxygenase-like cupin family protein|nr:hypothetical protein [Solirubrobacteraceae bacterium]